MDKNGKEPRKFLLAQWESNPSGSPESGRLLVEALQHEGWEVSVVVAHPGKYVDIYRSMGCSVEIITQKHWLHTPSWFRYLKTLPKRLKPFWQIRKHIRKLKPEIVYINTISGPEMGIAARSCGVPVIWHIRELFAEVGGELHGIPLFGKWGVKRILSFLAAHIVAVSKAVRNNVVEPTRCPNSVVYNGLPETYFEALKPRETYEIKGDLVIGVPANLRPMKGQDFLLEVLAQIAPQLGNFEVRMTGVGGETYRRKLDALADVPELKGRIKFVGRVSDMAGFLAACDFAVIPSSGDPLPRTVMEVMASGTPLIATRTGGIPEMLDDGENGLLANFGDHAAMTDCILKMFGSAEMRERFGQAAAAKAKANFRVAHYQDALLKLVNEVAPGRG